MKNFRELHGRTKRGTLSSNEEIELSEEELLAKAKKLFQRIKRKKNIQELVPYLPDTSIRIDLVGSPEVSFMLLVKKGKLCFSSERMNARLAIGIHKQLFLKIVENPQKIGNLHALLDNIFLRKGPVREFQWLKPILMQMFL